MTTTDAILADLNAELDAEGVFTGLPVDDGELLVAALSFDVCLRGDPARSMRSRASAVRAGRWPCEDRAGVARAFDIAATLLEVAMSGPTKGCGTPIPRGTGGRPATRRIRGEVSPARRSGPAPLPLPPAWADLIEAYLAAEAGAGRSPNTLVTRRGHLSHMARGLRCGPARVTEAAILAWFGRQAWSIETRRANRNTAVSFFGWASRSGHLATNPAADLPVMRAATPAPRPAPDAVWSAAIASADPRVRLMLRLAAEAGLRRAEIARVHRRDLTRGPGGAVLLVHGKGGKLRTVPLGDDLAAAIAADGAGGYLFPGTEDGHLSPRWVGKRMAGALPDHWTAHTLRHRFATRAYRGSRNLRAVQTLLGHSSVATTERYTAVDDAEIRAAMMAALGDHTIG